MKILLTGGLGYIGSHIASLLSKNAIIIDNSVNSSLNFNRFLPKATVYKKDLNKKNLKEIFSHHDIKGVIHLAGLKSVNQSVKQPTIYYKNNVTSSLDLIESMDNFKINKLIFSSSATVYGEKNKSPLKENMQLEATNPYGNTKIIIEKIINDYANSNKKFKAISLRYFNPLGADYRQGLQEKPKGELQNLMPILLDSIIKKKKFNIYGKNYKTYDGTCIRDYIHVKDVAKAHILAIRGLQKIIGHEIINLGLGRGISTLEIIKLFEKINKIKINYQFSKRRKGDVSESYADNKKAKKILGWKAQYNYSDMVKDSWMSQMN
jgi:UDP-glucose 4-epimerase